MSVDLVAAKDNVTALEIATRIVLEGVNGIPIIDDLGNVIGIVTTIDLLRLIRENRSLDSLTATDIMTRNPHVVKQDTSIEKIIDIMDDDSIDMVPVVDDREDDNRIIGVVSRFDILNDKLNERFVTIGRKRKITRTLGEK